MLTMQSQYFTLKEKWIPKASLDVHEKLFHIVGLQHIYSHVLRMSCPVIFTMVGYVGLFENYKIMVCSILGITHKLCDTYILSVILSFQQ